MSGARAYSRAIICALVALSFIITTGGFASAKARLVAIIVLRSTPATHKAAIKASNALATRIAQEPGWDARVIDAHGRAPADAAAAIGAELYVVGQYVDGPPHVAGAIFRVATDDRLSEFAYDVSSGHVPASLGLQGIFEAATFGNHTNTPLPSVPARVAIPSGELISVVILSDIGSRISQEGDPFEVLTAEDYYYKGQLVLPKGSPGYGVITHLKRAGSFHAGGELNFTVKRLVTPSRSDIAVETNGATADADKVTEHNGDTFGQYLLWGVGMFAKRGNDILIKKGTLFHVATLANENVPVAAPDARPAQLDPVMQVDTTGQIPVNTDAPATTSVSVATLMPISLRTESTADMKVFAPPAGWIARMRQESGGIASLGFWISPSGGGDENISVVTQAIPEGMKPQEFVALTLQGLQRSVSNVRAFRATRICNGNMDGWYAESDATVGIREITAEQTIGLAGNQSYIATYTRPQRGAENVAARRALDSLCPGAA